MYNLCDCGSQGHKILRKLSNTRPNRSLLTIYKSFMRPPLDYVDVVYDQIKKWNFLWQTWNATLANTGANNFLEEQELNLLSCRFYNISFGGCMSPDWKTHTVWIYPITLKYCFIKARTAKFTSAQAITAPPLLIASTNLCIESNSPITNVLQFFTCIWILILVVWSVSFWLHLNFSCTLS